MVLGCHAICRTVASDLEYQVRDDGEDLKSQSPRRKDRGGSRRKPSRVRVSKVTEEFHDNA